MVISLAKIQNIFRNIKVQKLPTPPKNVVIILNMELGFGIYVSKRCKQWILSHRIGNNPKQQEAIDERGSVIQSAFYCKMIKHFFFFNRKNVLKAMMSIKWFLDMFKDVPREIWLLGFN